MLVFFGSLPRRTKARGLLTGLAMAVALGASVGLHQLRWAGVTTLGVAEAGGSSCVVVIRDGSAGGVLSLGGYNDSSGLYLLQGPQRVPGGDPVPPNPGRGGPALCPADIGKPAGRADPAAPGGLRRQRFGRPGVPVERARPGESFQLLPGLEAAYSQDGARLSFTAGGVDVIVELAPSGPGECQVLVTQQRTPR